MAFKLMNLRRDDHCAVCVAPTPAAQRAWWDSIRKEVTCTRCRPVTFEPAGAQLQQLRELPAPQPISVGVAGGSATVMYERRATSHRHGLSDVDALPHHVTAWRQGADGEQRLGRYLDEAFGGAAVVLHDRHVVNGAKRGNIDHVIIASSGVWVIDAKKSARTVDGMGWQCAAVQSLLEPMGMGAVPVHPALCFVESEWSGRSNAAVIDNVLVLSPDKLFSVASQPGGLQADAINAIATQLSSGLPAVTPR